MHEIVHTEARVTSRPPQRQPGKAWKLMSEEAAEEFAVPFRKTAYDGYRSFSYLKAGDD